MSRLHQLSRIPALYSPQCYFVHFVTPLSSNQDNRREKLGMSITSHPYKALVNFFPSAMFEVSFLFHASYIFRKSDDGRQIQLRATETLVGPTTY
jgi:hypothetical protein